MKKIWNARKDSEGVSPVIATILMVAITVVLAAILMVMVMGMTGGSAPTATISAVGSGSDDKVNVTVSFISSATPRADISFVVNGTAITTTNVVWAGTSTDAISGSTVQLNATLVAGIQYTVQMLYQGNAIATTTFTAST